MSKKDTINIIRTSTFIFLNREESLSNPMRVSTLGHSASEWLRLLHNFCGSVGLAALVSDAPFDISTRSR